MITYVEKLFKDKLHWREAVELSDIRRMEVENLVFCGRTCKLFCLGPLLFTLPCQASPGE